MEQHEVFAFVLAKLEELGVPYMVVGSVASISYGEPRLTLDMDVVVDLRFEDVSRLCAMFPPEEFYISPKAAVEAIIHRTQFNLIHPASGNKVDFMIPQENAWGRQQLAGRRLRPLFGTQQAYAARPEDIIISKLLYYREGESPKHLRDIAGMLKVSPEQIDRQYVTEWATKLDVLDIWQSILAKVG